MVQVTCVKRSSLRTSLAIRRKVREFFTKFVAIFAATFPPNFRLNKGCTSEVANEPRNLTMKSKLKLTVIDFLATLSSAQAILALHPKSN